MKEPTQILLVFVITTLTIIMTAVGVQIFLILNEIRQMVAKMNNLATSFSNTLTSLSGVAKLFDWLMERVNQRREKEKEKEKTKSSNFFVRNGKPLVN